MADLPDYYTQAQISEAEAAHFKGGLDANKSATPVSRDIYLATDTHILYVCFVDGTWTGFDASILTQGILTLYADVVGGGFEVKSIKDPTAAQSAATRAYVLAQIQDWLLKTGGTMSGAIAMGANKITGMGDPTAAQDAATKAYVDLFTLLTTFNDHSARHEDTGGDEVSIEGLAGSPAQKAAASGLASLNASSLVVQKPADRLSKANFEITLNKILLGAGAGADPTEIDVPATKEIYIPALPYAGKEAKVTYRGVAVDAAGDGCFMRLLVPQDFVSITAIEVIFLPAETGANMHFSLSTNYGVYTGGESWGVHSESSLNRDIGATVDGQYKNHSISDLVDSGPLAAGDILCVDLAYSATAIDSNTYVSGLRLKYT